MDYFLYSFKTYSLMHYTHNNKNTDILTHIQSPTVTINYTFIRSIREEGNEQKNKIYYSI